MRATALALGLTLALTLAGCGDDGGSADVWVPPDIPFADTPTAPDGGGADTGTDPQDTGGGSADTGTGSADNGTPPGDNGTPPGDNGTADAPGPDATPPGSAPTVAALPTLTLKQGHSTTLDLNPLIADAEDADADLVVTWTSAHVALADPGDHVLLVVAPTDWVGAELIPVTVADTDGWETLGTLTVVVEEATIVDPPDPEPACGETTFTLDAGTAATEVLLTGSFTGWATAAPAAHALADPDGDGVWEVTVVLDPGEHAYKFLVDGVWTLDPANPDKVDDTFGGFNSVVTVPPCEDPGPGPGPAACGETAFSLDAGTAATTVLLSGTFNGWASTPETATVMGDPDGDGVWEATLTLEPGSYAYKFIVDGVWKADPANPDTASDGNGGVNSVLVVPPCPKAGALTFVSHALDAGAGSFQAVFAAAGDAPPAAADVEVTVDWDPAPAGAVTVDGATVTVAVSGLATGIHDVRVTAGGETTLLKVYVGVSTNWRDAVLYFVMTDRFANGDAANDAPIPDVDPRTNYQGGDFRGVIDRLKAGYFTDLGVGALWLSWPVDNPDFYEEGSFPDVDGCNLTPQTVSKWSPMRFTGYHGYWPVQLDQVESRFGTLAELRELVGEAHARGIRVLLDFTANHVHAASPFYQQHKDDGTFNTPAEICQDVGWDTKPLTCWFTSYLPDLDHTSAAAREAMLDHAMDWVKSSGADGFRFDAVKHLEMGFVEALRARVKAELELTGVDFYLVGETFTGSDGLIASFVGPTRLHGQFDFPANLKILEAFAKLQIGLDAMDQAVRAAKATYGPGALMSTFLGNHDIARFISHAAGSLPCGAWDVVSNQARGWRNPPSAPLDEAPHRLLRLAFTYVMTIPGVPLIYYGDEIGMPGGGDPDNRRMMRFGASLAPYEMGTLAFMKTLGAVRAAHPALRKGSWPAPLWQEGDFLAYGRADGADKVVVALNRGTSAKSASLGVGGLGLADGTTLADALGAAGSATVSGGQLAVTVPARSAALFVITP